jgi:hypothetical protein
MTIRRAEAVDGEVPITIANAEMIKRTLEAAGVEFTNEGAPGVRMLIFDDRSYLRFASSIAAQMRVGVIGISK